MAVNHHPTSGRTFNSGRVSRLLGFVFSGLFFLSVVWPGIVVPRLSLLAGEDMAATATLRVIEVRYLPDTPVYDPDWLSTQLQALLRDASRFHYYSNPTALPAIQIQVVAVYNHYTPRPDPDGTWYGSFAATLAADNLCDRINAEDIDQIWLWVDPVTDPRPGVEYAISGPFFGEGAPYATVASPAFCGGQRSFGFMGFDTTRPPDYALHSFGHFMEGLLGTLQTVELFWYRYAGDTDAGYPLTERCGNVHFPPNGEIDYDYDNPAFVETTCEDWNPQATGLSQHYNCGRWGCNQQGYLLWWLQNMPNAGHRQVYQGQYLPNWWDFTQDMDANIQAYLSDREYFMNRAFLEYPYTLVRVETDPVQIQGQKALRHLFDGVSVWPNTAIVHQVNEAVGVLLEFEQPLALEGFQVAVAGASGDDATYTWKIEKADTWSAMLAGNTTVIRQNYATNQQGMVTVPFGATHTAKVFKITASRDNGDGYVHLLELVPLGNFPPRVYAGLNQTIAEGSSIVLSGNYTDPNAGDTHTLHWDFGDGLATTGWLTTSHLYADDGVFSATLTITDNLGAAGTDTRLVAVKNVSPTLNSLDSQVLTPSRVVTLTGVFTDPGLLDAHQVRVVWQAGVSDTLDLPAGEVAFEASYTFATAGTYPVAVTVYDDDGGCSATQALTFTFAPIWHRVYLPALLR